MEDTAISVVILTYNGKGLLGEYLPSVLEACWNYSSGETEIVVVDDASNDGTEGYLRDSFPCLRLVKQPFNKGFAFSANLGVYSAKNDLVVLLNNDVKVNKDFLVYLPGHFQDKDVFAVRPALMDYAKVEGNKTEKQRISGGFRRGFFNVPITGRDELRIAFFAGGGACCFDKKKFMDLGGFDTMFSPFYYEDVDLSYRAWKRGFKIIYEPNSQAYHLIGGTIPRFYSRNYVETVTERNRYILVWKNIRSKSLLFSHTLFIPFRIIFFILSLRFSALFGFFRALGYLKEIIEKRDKEKRFIKMSDRAVFGMFRG